MGCCIAIFAFAALASAETHPWKWADLNSDGHAYLMANSSNLNTSYSGTVFTNGMNLWNNSSGHIDIAIANYSNSNVDYYSVTSSTWKSNGWKSSLIGWTQVYNGGTACYSDSTASDNTCTKTVNYAGIFMNDANIPSTSAKRSAVLAHEAGHAVGLGHTLASPSQIASMMNPATTSNSPTKYDVDNLNAIYP